MVYILQSGEYFKVGFSKDVVKRMSAYNTHNPDWVLKLTIKGGVDLEAYLKRKLREYKHRGEWFLMFDGWLGYVEELANRYDPAKEGTPHWECKYDKEKATSVFKIGLSRSEFDLWFSIVMYYGFHNNSGKLPPYIELDPKVFGAAIKQKPAVTRKAIVTLIQKGLIKKHRRGKHKYEANPMYIDPHVYVFPKYYEDMLNEPEEN